MRGIWSDQPIEKIETSHCYCILRTLPFMKSSDWCSPGLGASARIHSKSRDQILKTGISKPGSGRGGNARKVRFTERENGKIMALWMKIFVLQILWQSYRSNTKSQCTRVVVWASSVSESEDDIVPFACSSVEHAFIWFPTTTGIFFVFGWWLTFIRVACYLNICSVGLSATLGVCWATLGVRTECPWPQKYNNLTILVFSEFRSLHWVLSVV